MICRALLSLCAALSVITVPNAQTITSGKNSSVYPNLVINSPKFRMDAKFDGFKILEVGPSSVIEPFLSGLVKNQIGVLLCKADPCNFISYMLDFNFVDNVYKVRIQTKTNLNSTKSSECKNNGYSNSRSTEIRPIKLPMVLSFSRNDERTYVKINDDVIIEHYKCEINASSLRTDNVSAKILMNPVDR